jgi:hypothetical protein
MDVCRSSPWPRIRHQSQTDHLGPVILSPQREAFIRAILLVILAIVLVVVIRVPALPTLPMPLML